MCVPGSGGDIFLSGRSTREAEKLLANVSDGGPDCRRHNNNRLDTTRDSEMDKRHREGESQEVIPVGLDAS
jgi:hypothetical protein